MGDGAAWGRGRSFGRAKGAGGPARFVDGTSGQRNRGKRRGAMDDLRLSYSPRSGATPEREIAALAAVYRLVIERA